MRCRGVRVEGVELKLGLLHWSEVRQRVIRVVDHGATGLDRIMPRIQVGSMLIDPVDSGSTPLARG